MKTGALPISLSSENFRQSLPAKIGAIGGCPMRISSILCAVAALASAVPAQAAPCTKFIYSVVPFAVEFADGQPGTPVTSWPTLLVGITIVPSYPRQPAKFVRSKCGPKGYLCYRNVADRTDTIFFKLGKDSDGQPWLIPYKDFPGRGYYSACEALEEFAKEDARKNAGERP